MFGMKLGVESVSALWRALDSPLASIPTVLVAGTNGKGSTAAFTASILGAAGVRTLLYTSPHIASVRERIRIDGRMISTRQLGRRLEEVRTGIRRLARQGALPHHPTFFEVVTMAALLAGRASRVQAAVVEVGLGGRHDATNILSADVCVITSIGRDHTRHLGRTLAQIAGNKAGIVKGGERVVTSVRDGAAAGVIRRRAKAQGATLTTMAAGRARPVRATWTLDLTEARRLAPTLPPRLAGIRLGIGGGWQVENAPLAVTAAAALCASRRAGSREGELPALRARNVRDGLAAATLAGRFEVRLGSRGRRIILDGAHNVPAAVRLMETLAEERFTLLFGALEDKQTDRMLHLLCRGAERVILCRVPRLRAADPRDLARQVPQRVESRVVDDPAAALRAALSATPPGGRLLITGSFSLLGAVAPYTRRLRKAHRG